MSTSNLRMLVSKIPKVSLKGLAYLASANFLARAIILLKHYILTSFNSEMILIYGATLDTRILLFFQAIYMIPMFLLGVLVLYGIDRESFNLVLYPTLMLVFLILIRYGSEAALLAFHWEDHKFDQMPEVVFALLQDIIFIALLLVYVYFCLAFTPIKPTPLELIESGSNTAFVSAAQGTNLPPAPTNSQQQLQPVAQLQLPPPVAQQQLLQLPPNQVTDPDSQGFNYSLRRNVDQIPKETLAEAIKPVLEEIDKQRQQNAMIARERESGCNSGVSGAAGVKETDLDAVPTTSSPQPESQPVTVTVEPTTSTATAAAPEEPVVIVKLNKSRIAAARKKLAEGSQKEPEKPAPPAEPEVDFWGSTNGESATTESASKPADGFKTTSV